MATNRPESKPYPLVSYILRLASFFVHRASCILYLVALFAVVPQPVFAEDSKVAATVNGVAITENEVNGMIEQIIPTMSFHPDLAREKKEQYRKDAVERLIVSELLYQEAVRLGISAPDADVRKIFDEQRGHFKSKSDFEDALKKRGLTETSYEKEIRNDLAVEKLMKTKVDEPSKPAAPEVKDYYEANKKRFMEPEKIKFNEIFIYIAPDATDKVGKEKMDKAAEVFGQVKKGGDFCKLAQEYSDDALRDKCGDIGYVHKGRLEEDLENEVWNMKDGEVKMITISKGIMIARLTDRKPERQMSFDEVRPGIEKQLANEKKKKLSDELIKGLREKAKIVIY